MSFKKCNVAKQTFSTLAASPCLYRDSLTKPNTVYGKTFNQLLYQKQKFFFKKPTKFFFKATEAMCRKNFKVEYLGEFEAIFKNVLGAPRWLNHEKNRRSKISWHCPFKGVCFTAESTFWKRKLDILAVTIRHGLRSKRMDYIEGLVNDDCSSYGFFNHECGSRAATQLKYISRNRH